MAVVQNPSGRKKQRPVIVVLLAGGLLAACVTTAPPPSRIARLAAQEAAQPASATPLSFEDIHALLQLGMSHEAILARVRAQGGPVDFSPEQIVAAHQRGVPLALLQSLHAEREKALHNQQAGKLAELDRLCAADLERERQRAAPSPCYGPWGPSRRGGMYWGW